MIMTMVRTSSKTLGANTKNNQQLKKNRRSKYLLIEYEKLIVKIMVE